MPPTPYRSQAEAEYAGQLAAREKAGELLLWTYEPSRWKIGAARLYEPDFLVVAADGVLEWHEVKDARNPRAQLERGVVKFRTMAKLYPFFRYWLAVRDRAGWNIEEVADVEE